MDINLLKIKKEMIDALYPIGSYYETSDINFNPNISWNGTWVQDTKGLTTIGAYEEGTNRPNNDRTYIVRWADTWKINYYSKL